MPESQPCPICGGSHPPDACPGVGEEMKVERVLTTEEQKEQKRLQKELLVYLHGGYFSKAQKIISIAEKMDIDLDVASTCQTVYEKTLEVGFCRNPIKYTQKIIDFANQQGVTLDVASACQKGLEKNLSNCFAIGAQKIISIAEKMDIDLDVASACQKGFERFFDSGFIFYVNERFPDILDFANQQGITLDVASACQKGLDAQLSRNLTDQSQVIIDFANQQGITLDVASACKRALEVRLSQISFSPFGYYKMIDKFADEIKMSVEFANRQGVTLDVTSAYQKGLEASLLSGEISYAKDIAGLSDQNGIILDFSKPEIVSACQKELEKLFSEVDISRVQEEVQEFVNFVNKNGIILDFSKPGVVLVCKKRLEDCLIQDHPDNINYAKQFISFAEKIGMTLDVTFACQRGLEELIAGGNLPRAERIIDFADEKEIILDLSKPKIVSVCEKELESWLLSGGNTVAEKIDKYFLHLSPEKAFDLYSNHLKGLLSFLEKKMPQVISQAQKSVRLFFSLFVFRENPERIASTLEANPFLFKVLENNPRFGPKLVLKYPKFDNVSRSKIQFLYEAKTDILAKNPDIDPNSLEFRKLMQEKLRDFDRNKEILAAMKEKGVDTDAFLDYDETQYFTLKSGEETSSFAERLQTPISRLGETLDSYAHQVKNVLSAYREDLTKIHVLPKSAEDLQKQIADLEVKIEEEKAKPDTERKDGKVLGMEKGIDSLRQKLAKIQTMPLWESIVGEIERFRILKGGLLKSQQVLIEAETQYQETLSAKMPSGVELSKLKAKIGQAKEEFTNNLAVLERRVAEFRDGLLPALSVLNSPTVSDRADSIVQEINEKTAEQFSHFDSDRTTLAGIFSEKTDKSREELEDSPMSIFIAARNPDIDLYQGNYSPCCICIESEHMGAECAIADYNTDLGVQIVNIWDETKNEPITAAWCWVGIDEHRRTALVVDNIESNTRFSSTFSDKLSQELFAYLKKYAKAIGVERVVLGKANNDLPTAGELSKLPEAEAKYSKLGGQNSRPDGYFLEAEDKSVKLLWERGGGKKKARRERKIIKLADMETNGLTKNDYVAILDLEEKIYEGAGLVRGNAMIEDMKKGSGLNYSVILRGKRPEKTESEPLGYLVAYEDKTDDGDPCVYLDDIALAPDCQGQDLGWKLLEGVLLKMKEKAKQDNKPVLFDMHLRQDSQRFFDKHREDMEKMDVKLVDSALVPDYYDDGEDALYQVYEVKVE